MFMRLLPVLTAVSLIYGCLGPQTDNKSKKTAATTDAAVLSDENGILTAEFDANSKNSQLIKASENSGIAGSEVVFPPGSLGINANITIEEGSNLANSSTLSELGLGSDNALSSAGAPLVITASEKVDASNPFTLAIPFAGTSLALAGDELLVIVYKVTKASEGGKVVVGIIPRAELTIENGKVKFATTFFGSYQPVFTEKPIETKVEAPSETPIEKKAEDATPPAKIMISGAPSGSSAVNALSVTVSGDDVSYYKYSLIIYASYGCDKANYGDEKEVSLPISDDLNTFGAGNMMLCVIGRDSNGNWMSAANAAKATWTRTTTTAAAVPFAIAASSPVAGSSAAAITGIIAVTFTDNVDQSTPALHKVF